MFYCHDCAAKNEWPITAFVSAGRCEICHEVSFCNDTPSRALPYPKEKDSDKQTPCGDVNDLDITI